MGFETGHRKFGGRQKGSPNKRTNDLIEALGAKKFDLVAELIEALPDLEAVDRVRALLELMQYVYPKRKAIEAEMINERIGLGSDELVQKAIALAMNSRRI